MTLRLATLIAIALVLVSCGKRPDEGLAYAVCIEQAKKDGRFAKAAFASQAESNIQASTGDSGIRVNVPYQMDGKKGLYQCIADKQPDGTYKVTF